jgi:hypothetical protein
VKPGDKIIINDNHGSLTVRDVREVERMKTMSKLNYTMQGFGKNSFKKEKSDNAIIELPKSKEKLPRVKTMNDDILFRNDLKEDLSLKEATNRKASDLKNIYEESAKNDYEIYNNFADTCIKDNYTDHIDKYFKEDPIHIEGESEKCNISNLDENLLNEHNINSSAGKENVNKGEELTGLAKKLSNENNETKENEYEAYFEGLDKEKEIFDRKMIDSYIFNLAKNSTRKFMNLHYKENEEIDLENNNLNFNSDFKHEIATNEDDLSSGLNISLVKNLQQTPRTIRQNRFAINRFARKESIIGKKPDKQESKQYEINCTVDYNCQISKNSFLYIPNIDFTKEEIDLLSNREVAEISTLDKLNVDFICITITDINDINSIKEILSENSNLKIIASIPDYKVN